MSAADILLPEVPDVPASRAYARRGRTGWLTTPVIIGLIVAGGWIIIALTIQWWSPYNPTAPSGAPLAAPSGAHLLGTDELGRDLLYRILTGGRVSIMVGLLATLVTVVAGVSIGTIAGYAGGWLDNVLMRLTDAMLAIPQIFLLILLATGFGQTPTVIILAIGLTAWPQTARIIRSVVLSVREKEYVEAARAIGSGHIKIVARHILPNALGAIVVAATLSIGTAILTESTLSYLGLGIGPPIASWGSTLYHAQEFIWEAPYYALFPGFMILMTVLCINFMGDGLRDAFDPRSFER